MLSAYYLARGAEVTIREQWGGHCEVFRARGGVAYGGNRSALCSRSAGSRSSRIHEKWCVTLRPDNYRDWVFLSAGFDMTYNPQAGGHDMFSNVFVPRWQYEAFLQSGKRPDKSIFVVEERGAETKGSINKHGQFQTTDLMGIGVEVKDESRFVEKWAYFSFDDNKSASPNPKRAGSVTRTTPL